MIGDYKFNRTTRRCDVGDRPLEPGEIYYSVVFEADEDFKRIDIAADAWKGPPDNAIGWWKNRVPRPEEKKREIAPPEVLIDLLRSMAEQPGAAKSRYLLALMLLRKRQLKVIDKMTGGSPIGAPQQDSPEKPIAASSDTMSLQSVLDDQVIEVDVVSISSAEAQALQEALIDLIYRDVDELPD